MQYCDSASAIWSEKIEKNLLEIKKKIIKHCQENILVSIHEGLLMNGIFIKLHSVKSEHDA